ncbi:polysaccharide lyase family 7 protein [Pseudoalteromonas sp. MMG010]|uniref:polysaccharide lyase family 7 protein n=1 Tax=Pseudoalteromonas sp. MMG010 TaxID=2822685 RepID=UPI001B3A3830|nr:polysaccharide lyase family 7 protein [Pseudoalteromonas sp. MMG010]MBQ4832021.1 polysaccharide lyase family 7 protein [Pseudoalteromonas sp. MMG010]
MKKYRVKQTALLGALLPLSLSLLTACGSTETPQSQGPVPADKFDLSHWKITIPVDLDNNGKIDEVSVKDIQSYAHPDFFYLDDNGGMVFAAPNKAITTANSTNTRSELRQMIRGSNTKIKTKYAGNNFAIDAHPLSERFGAVGGKMEATLKVDHVATRATDPTKSAAYSVVVGQIHAGKDKALVEKNLGFGWGNEPLKIYFKKWPDHEKGSVFWNYERNLPKTDPARKDITYPVWGNTWENPNEPGDAGIALGEEFSYTVNVHGNIMHLTFSAQGKPDVNYSINLANNVDAYGKVDEKDHPLGYTADWNYFKAGAYNQCSTKLAKAGWYPGCLGTGDWKTDKANGDYVQVTFSKLKLSPSTAQ